MSFSGLVSFLQTNTFQCVMITDGMNSFVIFNYADGLIQWTTGDGHVDSEGIKHKLNSMLEKAIVHASQILDINIASTTNIERPGVWIFHVDERS